MTTDIIVAHIATGFGVSLIVFIPARRSGFSRRSSKRRLAFRRKRLIFSTGSL